MRQAACWPYDQAERLDWAVRHCESIWRALQRRRLDTAFADRPALNRRLRLTTERLNRLRQARRLARRGNRLATLSV